MPTSSAVWRKRVFPDAIRRLQVNMPTRKLLWYLWGSGGNYRSSRESNAGTRKSAATEPLKSLETFSMAKVLIPLTIRLSPSTAAALKRAGLEQRLYGRTPGTVQEIVEEAIVQWLCRLHSKSL
jgi:hypothetical protein